MGDSVQYLFTGVTLRNLYSFVWFDPLLEILWTIKAMEQDKIREVIAIQYLESCRFSCHPSKPHITYSRLS